MYTVREFVEKEHPELLDEVTLDDVVKIFDPRDLPHRDYLPLLKYSKYVGTQDNIMKFFVPSPTKINAWNVYVQFDEWDAQVKDLSLKPIEAARLLINYSDIKTYCGCPSYSFWGFQHIQTQLDMAIVPEIRFPSIRNPHLLGIACKHIRKCLPTVFFHSADIAKAIREQRQHFS